MKIKQISAALLAAAGMLFCLNGAALAQKVLADQPNGATSPSLAGNNQSKADMHFAREAAEGGMLEVELGKIAVQKASNEKIRQFGQRMIDDHTKLNNELKSVAAKDNITLPTSLDAKHQAIIDRFSKLSGTGFDRTYARDMVRDHEKDIADFEKEANNGTNPDLKGFASMALPILREHLRLAQDNENALGITSRK